MSPHRLLPSLQDRCDQRFRWTSSRAANATADRAGHRPWGPRRPGLVDAPSRCWWAPSPLRTAPPWPRRRTQQVLVGTTPVAVQTAQTRVHTGEGGCGSPRSIGWSI